MNLIGRIEKIDSNYAHVHVQPASACGHCGSCGGCSTEEGRHIKIKNNNYRMGQFLDIQVNDNQALYALLASAGLILALLIGGYYLGTSLFTSSGEAPGIIGGLIGVIVGSLIVKILEPIWQKVEYQVTPLD